MSQSDVIKYLKKMKMPVDINQMIIALPGNRASISRNCEKLRNSKEIKFKTIKLGRGLKYFYYLK
jgi:hypothetical protein